MAMRDLGRGVWHDPEGTGYIGLDLTTDIAAPPRKVIEGTELSPKSEYHCSLVDVRHYIGDDQPAREMLIGNAVKDYLREHDLRFTGLAEERYLCRKEDRTTLVAPVRFDGFEGFATFIQTHIGRYRPPFLHVTLLMSDETPRGISINSEDDLATYCRKLTTWSC